MSSQSFSIYIYMHKLLACCYFVVLLGIMRVTLQKSAKTCRSCIYPYMYDCVTAEMSFHCYGDTNYFYLKFADDKMAG